MSKLIRAFIGYVIIYEIDLEQVQKCLNAGVQLSDVLMMLNLSRINNTLRRKER